MLTWCPRRTACDDLVWILGPSKEAWIVVGVGDVAVDRFLERDEGMKHTALEPLPGEFGEEALTALTQEAEVGVKWNMKRGCRASELITLGCLWAA